MQRKREEKVLLERGEVKGKSGMGGCKCHTMPTLHT